MTTPTRSRLPRGAQAFNRVALRLVRFVPIWADLTHVGRKSGRAYHTPVAVLKRGGVYRIALAWGADADWVRNVMTADEFTIVYRGTSIVLTEHRIVTDPTVSWAPPVGRQILRRKGIHQHIAAKPQSDTAAKPHGDTAAKPQSDTTARPR